MSDDHDAVTDAVGPDAEVSGAAKPVSRRAALKVLGAVPVAGALIGSAAFAQQGTPTQQSPQRPKQTHEAGSPPAEGTYVNGSGVTPAGATGGAMKSISHFEMPPT